MPKATSDLDTPTGASSKKDDDGQKLTNDSTTATTATGGLSSDTISQNITEKPDTSKDTKESQSFTTSSTTATNDKSAKEEACGSSSSTANPATTNGTDKGIDDKNAPSEGANGSLATTDDTSKIKGNKTKSVDAVAVDNVDVAVGDGSTPDSKESGKAQKLAGAVLGALGGMFRVGKSDPGNGENGDDEKKGKQKEEDNQAINEMD